MASDKVEIFTDGACSGNPGPGGWGALILCNNNKREVSGSAEITTNNRMELVAVIEALKSLSKPANIRLYTDSTYVKDGITKWIKVWRNNGWRTAAKKPVKNVDLWQQLEETISNHQIDWVWIRGHSGQPGNERADALARSGINLQKAK